MTEKALYFKGVKDRLLKGSREWNSFKWLSYHIIVCLYALLIKL